MITKEVKSHQGGMFMPATGGIASKDVKDE